MSEKIKELLRMREHLTERVSQTKKLINSLETHEGNYAVITGCLGPGRVYLDPHLMADILKDSLAKLEEDLKSVNAKVEAINVLLES